MAKAKSTVFFCQNCGYESAKWMGQCPGCREWNTFVEETVVTGAGKGGIRKAGNPHTAAEPETREDKLWNRGAGQGSWRRYRGRVSDPGRR